MKKLSLITRIIVIMTFLLLDPSYNTISEQAEIGNKDTTEKSVEESAKGLSQLLTIYQQKRLNKIGTVESAKEISQLLTMNQLKRTVATCINSLSTGEPISENNKNLLLNDLSLVWNLIQEHGTAIGTVENSLSTEEPISENNNNLFSDTTEADINACINSLSTEEPISENNNDNLLFGAFISKIGIEKQPRSTCVLQICLNQLDDSGFNNSDPRKIMTQSFKEVKEVPIILKGFSKLYFYYLKRHEKNTENKLLPHILKRSSFCLSQTCIDCDANYTKEKFENNSGLNEKITPFCVQQVCLGQTNLAGFKESFSANDSIHLLNNNTTLFTRQNLYDYDFIYLFNLYLRDGIPQIDKTKGPIDFCSYVKDNENIIAL